MSVTIGLPLRNKVDFLLDKYRMTCHSVYTMRKHLHFMLLSLLGLLFYVLVLPRLGLWLDHRLALLWRLPGWTDAVAAALILIGSAFAVWYFWTLVFLEDPAESAAAPSRAQMIFGSWALGAGLALLLRSICLMLLVAIVAIAATVCFRRSAQQSSFANLRAQLGRFRIPVPAWLILTLVLIGAIAGSPRIARSVPTPHVTEPAILVEIRCKPGTAELWREDFEQHLRPAIEEAVGQPGSYTSFQFLEPALPGQGFDFALLYTGTSFASLDQPRIFPQYVALVDREGPARALATVREMSQWEDHVTVSLVHLSKKR